jgi:hypothetical protein
MFSGLYHQTVTVADKRRRLTAYKPSPSKNIILLEKDLTAMVISDE